jgi:hypothetical protein
LFWAASAALCATEREIGKENLPVIGGKPVEICKRPHTSEKRCTKAFRSVATETIAPAVRKLGLVLNSRSTDQDSFALSHR